MEQLTKNQAVATSQEAVQNQNEPQLRDENAHNDKSVHGVLNPTYQAGLRRDAVQPDIEAERKKRDEIEAGKSYCSRRVGAASIVQALGKMYEGDFRQAELLSLPVTLVIMVGAFGALLAAAAPGLLALTSVAAAIGLSGLASHLLPVTETTASVVLLIGMAVGVDYSLFYVRRVREERARGRTALDAVEIAAATSGRAIVVSGGTVAVAMAGMFLTGSGIFGSLALGAILVVAVAVLGSVTVLPAVLAG